jgi:nucleoside-diphosphate-sugar epimerase
MPKALVTGASGFIGSHLVQGLLKRGYEVRCLVRSTSARKWLEGLQATFSEGDCTDTGSLREAVEGMDFVFHVAGLTKARRDEDFYSVNAEGARNLAEAVSRANPSLKKFIFLSSQSAAGPSIKGKAVREEDAPNPVSHYGKSKLQAEKAVLEYANKFPVVIIRPSAVYGPRDRDFFVFFKLLRGGICPWWGESRYSLIYVDDLITGIIKAAESREASGKVFFLADEKPYTNKEIISLISGVYGKRPIKMPVPRAVMSLVAGAGHLLGFPSIINRDKMRELSYREWVCDTRRAREELGFISKIKLKEGIKWTADWYRIHQWL